MGYVVLIYKRGRKEKPLNYKMVSLNKSGKKEKPLNYRMVSLTSVVCKLCERMIKKQWIEFLEDNKLVSDRQFGFRKVRSCITNLLSFYSRVVDII